MTDAQTPDQNTPSAESAPSDTAILRSLAPAYNPDHHDIYVEHLETVVNDTKNKNVALTGRYGTGKSSVLDKFEENHKNKVLRVSIATLGPDRDGEGVTNRIQKELVKQLVYRTKPNELRSSRFARTDFITPKKAWVQGAIATAVLGLFLGLGGWLPAVATLPDKLTTSARSVVSVLVVVLAWVLFYATATAIASWLRMVLASRIVTSLSTAGTSITLGERDDTYFDTYLDELVTYFDRGGEDYVIFEDLDRFDDPTIFDSLRELNTILNSSPRRHEAAPGRQLCFIYAIKDSLFERLAQPEVKHLPEATKESCENGSKLDKVSSHQESMARRGPEGQVRVQRAALAERANRTKFFDVVIPMVPFLSHRNARDVLDKELAKRNIPTGTVSRTLLSLVARHATDMRLLLNILNEFTVYAQRLLWVPHPAPELTGDRLFALVAYKNFHLADFEGIPVRESALDKLDRAHRDLVRQATFTRQKHRREARDSVLTEPRQSALADRFGNELMVAARAVLFQNQPRLREPARYRVGSETFTLAKAHTIGFWQAVVQHQSMSIDPFNGKQPHQGSARELDRGMLHSLFPDAFEEGLWLTEQEIVVGRKVEALTEDLDFLPGAGYADLMARPEFEDEKGRTFANLLEEHLTSDISRELVRKGYINRNFATYSSAFYGTFVGIDAETFYYRAIQPNEMLLDHRFDSDASMRNLLDQLDNDEPDFYCTVSALNPQIVTYLLEHRPGRAVEVAGFIATHFDEDARVFMTTYLAEDHAPHTQLIRLLAAHPWHDLFNYLASDAVPESLRLELVDAALTRAANVADFALGEDFRGYVAERYTGMNAFNKKGQSQQQAEVVKDFAIKCNVQVENLAGVARPLRELLTASRMYVLTADNLRAALGVEGAVSMDAVAKNEAVSSRCLTDIDAYLHLVDVDLATPYAVETRGTLLELLSEDQEWSANQLNSILERSSPDSSVEDLAQAPLATWRELAGKHRFALTVRNLSAYIEQFGIDFELAGHLTADRASIQRHGETGPFGAEGTEESTEVQRTQLALALINAHEQLEASDRAALAIQLDVGASGLPVTELEPAPDDFLAEALDRGLLEATEEVFDHFATAGWSAVSKALTRHYALRQFVRAARMDDELTRGMLEDSELPVELHDRFFGDFDSFIMPTSTEPSLYRAAARIAVEREEKLNLERISRIAEHAPDQETVIPLLAAHQGLDGDQLVMILTKLGEPYNLLQTTGAEADLPAGDSAGTLFNRLVTTGRIKFVNRKTRFRVL